MHTSFTPSDWYWFVGGDHTQIFSSARGVYVPIADATYQSWLLVSGHTTYSAPTEADLYNTLTSYGVGTGTLSAPVPSSVSRWAFRAALYAFNGGDKDTEYDTWISANKSGKENLYYQWNAATNIIRASNLVSSIMNQTSLTSNQMDNIFIASAKKMQKSGVN